MSKLSGLIAKVRNNPDYAAALMTGYGSMALQIVVQILLVPLYLHALGNYRFGALMILSSQIAFAYLFVGFFYSVLLRLFRESLARDDRDEFSRVYGAGKLLLLAIGLLFAIIVLGLETWHPIFFDDVPAEFEREIWWATAFASLHFFLLCEISVEQTLFSSIKRQLHANIVALIGLTAFVLAVVPWLLLDGGLSGVFACFVFGDVLSRVYAYVVLRRARIVVRIAAIARGIGAECRRLLSGGAALYYAYALLAMVLQSDVLIIGLLTGPEMTAQYVLVWKIAEVAILVIARLTTHLQPEFVAMDVAGDKPRLRRVYLEAYRWVFIVSLLCAAGYAIAGHWVMQLWVGEARAPSDMWLYVLAGAAIFWLGISRLPVVLAQAMSRMKALLAIAAVELAAKLLLLLALFATFELRSPLIAISVVHVLGIAAAYFWLGRRLVAPDSAA